MKRLFSLIIIGLFLFSFAAVSQDENASEENVSEDNAAEETKIVEEQAGFSEKKSTDWLEKASREEIGTSVFDLSLVILALNNKGVKVDSDMGVLKEQQDSDLGCFPADSCKVLDSALALVAFDRTGQDGSKIEDYLLKENTLTAGLKQGEWRLQLDVAGNGTCTVAYGEANKSKQFSVDTGVIKGTAGKYYIDIAKELDSSLITTKVSQPINIDCKDLAGVASLVYFLRTGNSYFLLDSQPLSAGVASLKIVNACFRSSAGSGGCDLDATLYATWGLVETGVSLAEIGTIPYLESTLITGTSNDLQKALLVRILQKSGNANVYFDNLLIKGQASTGSWGRGDIYTTSWGLFALQKASGTYGDAVAASTEFLKKRNQDDGSWGSIRNTAMALIALHGADLSKGYVSGSGIVNPDVSIPSATELDDICTGKLDDRFGRTGCSSLDCKDYPDCLCKNGRKDSGEEDIDCGGDCAACELAEEVEEEEKKEAEEIIPDEGAELGIDAEKGEKEGAGSVIWIVLLVILIVGACGGIIFYLKSKGKLEVFGGMFRKKPKGPSFEEFKKQLEMKPAAIQPRQAQPARPAARPLPARKPAEDELEKSLREAEKLLKGK